MIAERDTGRTVVSTLADQSENIAMSIDEGAMAHIMNVLTDLYSNPILAVIREYSTNAWDAHVAAGVTRPIEVTLPGALTPAFKVRDFGIGLGVEDIRSIYSQYGASTKRATNDQVGMLGLGCKSALTYTDQFSVESIKDGQKVLVSVERDEMGAGVMRVVYDGPAPSNEEPGTTITVPTKASDFHDFAEEARDFFRVWEPGTVLVGGEQPERVSGLWLTDKLVIINGEQSYVVMGNVPYPADINHGLPRGYTHVTGLGSRYIDAMSVMAFVDIGEVSFPPSREGLMYHAKTNATMKRIADDIARHKQGAIQRGIDAAASPAEAISTYMDFAWSMGDTGAPSDFTYKGKTLPYKFEPTTDLDVLNENTGKPVRMLLTSNSEVKMGKAQPAGELSIHNYATTAMVWGYDKKGMTPTQKRKLRKYVSDNLDWIPKQFALIDSKPSAEWRGWFGADHLIPWADVDAIKLPKVASSQGGFGRLPGSYDLIKCFDQAEHDARVANASHYTTDTLRFEYCYEVAGDEIDSSLPVYYIRGKIGHARSYAHILFEEHRDTGCYIVGLSANRIDKFCRILPHAKEVAEAASKAWQKAKATVTPAEALAAKVKTDANRALLALDPTRINDPEMVKAIKLLGADTSRTDAIRNRFASVRYDTDLTDGVEWSDPTKSYPLLEVVQRSYGYGRNQLITSDDMYIYLNAKYAETINTNSKGA
jgi:hypothetical protein